jgi:vWA-MoxR associated protein C-terminal domain/vWA-MoxR associated protein middle region 0
VSQLGPTEHRTIVVADVADFTNPARKETDMNAIHQGMYEVLEAAFRDSGVDFALCTHEDRGDGMLILVPADVPKSQLADRLPDRLVAAVRRYNSTRADSARFKLRVGLHAGDIRRNSKGWVGRQVNDAFRILEAPQAKTALANSHGVVALVVSDRFFADVIAEDEGSAPDAYERITVQVKAFVAEAWLRLPGMPVEIPAPRPAITQPDHIVPPIEGEITDPSVLAVIPPEALPRIRSWLVGLEVPNLTTLFSRAAGQGIDVPRNSSAWEMFVHLADFNAGADGVPPALSFLQLLAGQADDQVGGAVLTWVDQQARRLRLVPALAERRADNVPVPEEPLLHLVIALEPDSIEPTRRCALSYWRQDDPDAWPPPRGGVLEVPVDDLEHEVDKVIVDAERVWSSKAISVAVEFLLPRVLLDLPIRRWRKDHDSGQPRLLTYDYQLTVRSLERMRAAQWRRASLLRWDSMLKDPSMDRIHPFGPRPLEEHPIDAVLSDPHWVGLVLAKPPSPQPETDAGAPDELTAAFQAGLPLVFWHPAAGPADLRELVQWLLSGENGFLDVLKRHKTASISTTLPVNNDLARDLVVMLDDPRRVIVLDQPSIPAQR